MSVLLLASLLLQAIAIAVDFDPGVPVDVDVPAVPGCCKVPVIAGALVVSGVQCYF